MKKIGTICFGVCLMVIATSCSKKYCYECSAINKADASLSAKQECDLSKDDRDAKADEFEWAHPTDFWSTTCSRTSE